MLALQTRQRHPKNKGTEESRHHSSFPLESTFGEESAVRGMKKEEPLSFRIQFYPARIFCKLSKAAREAKKRALSSCNDLLISLGAHAMAAMTMASTPKEIVKSTASFFRRIRNE